MFDQKNKRAAVFVLSAAICVIVAVMWIFTSQTGWESNFKSYKIANYIEKTIAKYIEIDRSDVFWRETLNLLIRKAAHFIEFMVLGVFAYLLFHVLWGKRDRAICVSGGLCLFMSMFDEFRQLFVFGRNPSWYDVKVDIIGALCGIVVTAVILEKARE